MTHTYSPGKVDYLNHGRRDCRVEIEWRMSDSGDFAMSASVWNHIESDIYMGGQCLEMVGELFPDDPKVQRMVAIWRRWHLNHMRAGCSHQREGGVKPAWGEPCPTCGYRYGTAWLREELPDEVKAEILSWGETRS